MDVRQPQHQRPAIDYSVGQSLRQDRDTHYRELNAELRGNNTDRYSASLSGQLQNGIGNTTASIAHYQQRGRGETGYSGSHSSGFALGRRGFYWSGANGAEAGLAVQVDGFDDADLHGVAAELQVGCADSVCRSASVGCRRCRPISRSAPKCRTPARWTASPRSA